MSVRNFGLPFTLLISSVAWSICFFGSETENDDSDSGSGGL